MQKKDMQSLFTDIKNLQEAYSLESMCTNCEKNGTTNIMLTKIPFFREIMICSFQCDQCGFRNNQVQFAGKLQDFGVDILFRVMGKDDLNRQLVKSEHAVIRFQEVDLEIPANGKAEISTIQGLLLRTYDELNFHQALRRIHEPENYEKLQIFLHRVKEYLDGQHFPLTVRIRDPSGNSNIKNPFAPRLDKNLQVTNFERSLEEMVAMGYSPENAKEEHEAIETKKLCTKLNFTGPFEESNFLKQEAAVFAVPCHACHLMGQMRMCQTSVPYFSDLVIMSFSCDYCGAHNAETKNSGEVRENASVITLSVQGDADLKRDLFKSETCAVNLPDIELELGYGTLGGVFTTVEGLLEKIHDHFQESNPFVDSDQEFAARIAVLLQDLKEMGEGKRRFTMILIDPLSHSFISNPFLPNEDPRLKIEFRPRTFDENEELGLNDINTENYKLPKQQEKPKEEPKQEQKEQPKQELKEQLKEQPKEETKEEHKQEPKGEPKEETKGEPKEESKEVPQQ